jgi:hypothetical protein
LQKAAQNPLASLTSVPLQNNTNFSLRSFNQTQDVSNIRPVIPPNLNKNWRLITQVIQPIDRDAEPKGVIANTPISSLGKPLA